ncbi:MAG: type I-C CRISPR-associated protein Cas5 [Holophagaceae bacterium]|nr:type I-C CRISPR-associated protein Cas5 [Holophagaceae bacterium]
MEHWDKCYCLEVRGDFACFTRPEMKVERVSYDVMTPSAARAIFEAILWKPAIHWAVRKIEVLNQIQWTSVRRNEVGAVMSGKNGLFIEDNRQQRAGLFLRDVAYRLHADLVYIPPGKRPTSLHPLPESLEDPEERILRGREENPGKYQAMFERRARKGQSFNQPYLGCREFSATSVRLVEDLSREPAPIPETRELGFMLYDLDFSAEGGPAPAFFRAKLEKGAVEVPDWDSPEVRR